MGYSKPSVSRAVGLLKEGGYLKVGDDGSLILTDLGREIAEKTYERHTVLSKLFVMLGVNPETAAADACKMEHLLGSETLNMMKKYVDENQKNFKKNS